MSHEKRKEVPVCSECHKPMQMTKDQGITKVDTKPGKSEQWIWIRRFECSTCETFYTKHDKQSVPLLKEQM